METFASLLLMLALTSACAQADPFPAVLTDNAVGEEPAIPTGVTYEAQPAYTNPPDTTGRRLLDRDRPWDDWNNTVGINAPEQTVTFDFGDRFRFSRFDVRLREPQRPASITISVGEEEEGPWQEAGVMKPAEMEAAERDWFSLAAEEPLAGRFVRMHFLIDTWGWYVKEVKAWGVWADEPPADVAIPHLREGDRLVIARGSQAGASIIVARDAAPGTLRAARFLQRTIRQMTGATLPLRDDSRDWEGGRILLGHSRLNPINWPQGLRAPEGYRIQVEGRSVALVGNDAGPFDGTRHAVSNLLWEWGCGWFGPDPLYHVIPARETLTLAERDVEETPDFAMRHVWMVRDDVLKGAWRLGGFTVHTAHVMHSLVPDALREQHPEWFGPGQPCLTHPGVRDHIVQQFRQRLDESPAELVTLSIGPNDTDAFCECDGCRAAGNVSARMMGFANGIADALRETHPGRFQLGFLAYWVTHGPPEPMVQGRPEVTVLIVNEGDHTKPLDAPVPPDNARHGRNNLREQRALEGWLETGSLQGVYEWWIPGCNDVNWRDVPWYSGETALRNLRYWESRGLRYLTYETQYEHGTGFPIRWPLYYMAARGSWDSTLRADEIMLEACTRLFGDAANHMFWFYRTLEMAMLHTPHPGGNWHLPSPELVYTPDIEARATSYITEAAQLAEDPDAQARIASELQMWEQARATLARLRVEVEEARYPVRYGDRTLEWSQPVIREQDIRELFGLAPDAPLLAVEGDGQRREVEPWERFDLRTGIAFQEGPL